MHISLRKKRGFKVNAQFLAVCSSSILAETPGYVTSFSSPWRGKRRVFERHKRLLTDQLQPSTNSDKLSELELLRFFTATGRRGPDLPFSAFPCTRCPPTRARTPRDENHQRAEGYEGISDLSGTPGQVSLRQLDRPEQHGHRAGGGTLGPPDSG